MTELIGNWLINCVGCNIRFTPETLGKTCFDGKIFANILIAYNICSPDYLDLINEATTPELALSNLKKLCVWFKLLGITITDKLLEEIVNKSGSACLRLLYELFIRLENRESMFYMDSNKKNRILSESQKFVVTPAPEEKILVEDVDEKQYLRDILSTMKGVMGSAEKDDVKQFILNGLKQRVAVIKEKILKEEKLYKSYKGMLPCPELEVNSKILEFEELMSSPEGQENHSYYYECSPNDYISFLTQKRRKIEADKKLKKRLTKSSMQDAWQKLLKNQETELKRLLSTKILKQSDYEKQMTLRLQRMRMQYKKFIENRSMIMEIADRQESVNHFKNAFHVIKEKEATMIEKQRIKDLHDKLFREKMRQKRTGDKKAFRRIIEDIVDFAMIQRDYFDYNGSKMPPKDIKEAKHLFIKGVRLLSHDLVMPRKPEEDDDVGEGPPMKLIDERIKELAEIDFYFYLHAVGPWFFKDLKREEPEILKIIGFIVHRLLDIKYDYKMAIGTPANLPRYDYKILLQHMDDIMAVDRLKNYLSKFNVVVIDVYSVVNYFLNSYKTFLGINTVKGASKNLSPSLGRRQSVSSPVDTKNIKSRGRSKAFSKRGTREKLVFEKGVQFPSCEELLKAKMMSDSANVGKYIYEFIQEGGLLPDAFVCYLIIEYLKTLPNINGWVLINYPESMAQIAILEFMFSGLEVPYMTDFFANIKNTIDEQLKCVMKIEEDVSSHVAIGEERNVEEMENEGEEPDYFSVHDITMLKNSEILPNPSLPTYPPKFESFFTNVILLQREVDIRHLSKKKRPTTPQPPAEEDENEEGVLTLDIFYTSLGVSTSFNYKHFDAITLKRLLRFLLNISSSKEQEFLKTIDDKENLKVKSSVTDELKNVMKSLGQKPDLNFWFDKMLAEHIEEEGGFEETEEGDYEESITVHPGQKNWVYSKMPISEGDGNILASIWESIEYFYIYNLKECFGLMRNSEKRLMPYRNYIRKKADECLNLEDDRTQIVTNFQLMFNDIDEHLRSLDEMKNELHCRTLKLQCDLWKITDTKKFYCNEVMELLKKQYWIRDHLMNLLRLYSFLLQIEIDRFADSMQLLEDYYSISVSGTTQYDRLTKMILPKIGFKKDPEDRFSIKRSPNPSMFVPRSSKTGLKVLRQRDDSMKKGKRLSEGDGKPGIYFSDFESEKNPFVSMMTTLISRLTKTINQFHNNCQLRYGVALGKVKNQTSDQFNKGKSVRSAVSEKQTSEHKVEVSENMQSVGSDVSKVQQEWASAMENEKKRVLFRISLIEKKAVSDIIENGSILEKAFEDFEKDIATLYHQQTINIEKVCDLIRSAIEEETRIQPIIWLKNDSLRLDPSQTLVPLPPPDSPTSLSEISTDYKFTISQLTNFWTKLVYVAPLGIVERTFVYILEDMACMGHETGHCYLPHYWSQLTADEIRDIVHRLFGDRAIIDWRQFIIFGLDLGYPTLENILDMRKSFRIFDVHLTETVTYEEYCCVFLWFESKESWSLELDLYYAKAKELLFKVFQTSENVMNYTEFLLAFCRDVNPKEGFIKALALAEGCATVGWKQDLFRETFQIERENEKYDVAYGIMTIVMAGVFRIVDSVIITDVVEEEIIPEEEFENEGEYPEISSPKMENRVFDNSKSMFTYTDEAVEEEDVSLNWNWYDKFKPVILWKSDVYFSVVFSLLLLDIHHFALSSDQIYEPIDLEENLKKIFRLYGAGHSMKLHILLNNVYFQELLSSYRCYQDMSLSKLLTQLVRTSYLKSKNKDSKKDTKNDQ